MLGYSVAVSLNSATDFYFGGKTFVIVKKTYICRNEQTTIKAMEELTGMGGITTIFGFLCVCLVMIWKVISDKKDNEKTKEMREKITEILSYITTERQETKRVLEEHTEQISKISVALDKILNKLNKSTNYNKNQKKG